MWMKKLTAWTLTAAMLSSMLPAPVFAAEANADQTLESLTQTFTAQVSPEFQEVSNDELFAGYADSVLYGYEIATFGEIARAKLNDIEEKIYDELKTKITAVAENGGNTVFELTDLASLDLKTEWAVNDLNVTDSTNQKEVSNALGVAFEKQFNWSDIIGALLSDCPLDLYWYDKTQSTGMNYTIQFTGTQTAYTSASVTKLTFTFKVAKDYQNDSDTTAKTADLKTVKDNAQEVVNANKDKTPYEKLKAYKEYICKEVSYNQTAVDNNAAYGDPWQLIYVFDGDSETNVVCEGYSKAFQYLCDLDDISTSSDNVNFNCVSPTGYMGTNNGTGGAHMWNVVTLDGASYLVDVTNCDGTSVGTPDLLFLKGAARNSYTGGAYKDDDEISYEYVYNFQGEGKTVQYYCHDLGIAETNYVATYPVTIAENIQNGSVTASPAKAAAGTEVTLTVEPDDGYVLTGLTVTGKDDKEVTVSEGYTFTMPAGGVTVTATFAEHIHDWSYEVTGDDGDTITATCGNADTCPTKTVTLTLVAPEGDALIYDGNAKTVTVEQSTAGAVTGLPEVTYTGATTDGKAINAGDYTATLTKDGATATVSFTIAPKPVEVTWENTNLTYNGAAQAPTATASGVNDEKVALTVSGEKTDAGTYTATASTENTNYTLTNDEVDFIIAPKPVEVAWENTSLTYNGAAQAPTATVNTGIDDQTLTLTVSGSQTNAGTYTATASTENTNYTLSNTTQEFTIAKKEISISGATITDLVYNENATPPYALNVSGVTFKAGEDDVSLTSEDYTATAALTGEYKIAQNVAATVTVTLKNDNYTLASTTFTNATVNIVEHTHAWTYTASGATITATCGNADTCPTKTVTLTLEAPANLTYDGKAKEVTVKQEPTGVFTDLPDVVYTGDPTINQAINAGTHTATLTMEEAKATLGFTIKKADPTYTVPTDLTATYGQKLSDVKFTDTHFAWADATQLVGNVGDNKFTATYTPDDTDNYNVVEDVEVTVKVNAKKITAADVTFAEDVTYNGSAQKPEVTTSLKTEDYTVTYKRGENETEDFTSIGTITVTVTGKGNYTGTVSDEFTIKAKEITADNVTVSENVTYNGSAQQPTVTVKVGENTLTLDKDYTVTYKLGEDVITEMINAGTYTVTVTGKGNYTTETAIVKNFIIVKAPQEKPTLTVTDEVLKGQNGTISGLTDKMEYSSTTVEGDYTEIKSEDLKDGTMTLAPGTYYVRLAQDENHNAGAVTTVTIAAGKDITVKFDANGQEATNIPAQMTEQSYGTKLTKPADPTATNIDFAFDGWYKDAECKNAWDFENDTLTEETVTITDEDATVTLYAKWKQVRFTVKATVTGYESGTVTAKLGDANATVSGGSLTFEHVEPGTYNLVVTYKNGSKTEIITVAPDALKFTVDLPTPGVSSELEVTGDDTPAVMVGGLDDVAASEKPEDPDKDVTVTMTVEGKTEYALETEASGVVDAIKEAIGSDSTTVEYLDISIEKKVDNAATGTPITETTNIIEILIPLGNRFNVKIIRHHVVEDQNADVKDFAQNNSKADGTFFIDTANGYIHIFTKKFSTYAVSSTSSCTITFNVNGGVGSCDPVTITGNGTVTLPEEPSRTDYRFKGWFTEASGGTEVTAETVFTGDTTVYAQWTQNSSGSNPGSNSNNDYSGGNYYPSAPTYPVSAPTKVENGSVSVSFKNASKGSTVTLTVTPDEGYELASLIVTDKHGNELTLTNKGNGKFSFIMPASKVSIKATFEEIAAEPETPVNPFYDVAEGDYYYDAVLWANEHGITSGVGYGLFAPHATCTRAQMVTFLWNAAGCPNVSEDYGTFTDVTANDYYYKAVLWANANNITSGTGNGAFSPNQICTRAQMATFLYKFAEGQAEGTYNPFVDVTASDYYAQPVQWAVENGITSGTGANTFGPNDPCTRAQMVTFLYRLLAE